MLSEADKFYLALLLLFNPIFLLLPAYAAAHATKMCIGFKPELYLLWPIVAFPVLVTYTRLLLYVTHRGQMLITVASGILYAYLFYNLTVPYVKCTWILGDMARTSEAAWAITVGVY